MPEVIYQNLGLIDYKEAWDFQETLFKQTIDIKIKNRRESAGLTTPNHLLFVSHPHVYTLGKSGDISNLLLSESQLESKGATFYKINRGGDITYHGPGQIVGYPILDLDNFWLPAKQASTALLRLWSLKFKITTIPSIIKTNINIFFTIEFLISYYHI